MKKSLKQFEQFKVEDSRESGGMGLNHNCWAMCMAGCTSPYGIHPNDPAACAQFCTPHCTF